jgi:hypothetical protein
MQKDDDAVEPWVSAPLLGHLPGDPGTLPPPTSEEAPASRPVPDTTASRVLAPMVIGGTVVLLAEIVLAVVTLP